MKQCRTDCIHAEACRRYADNSTYWQSGDCSIYKPASNFVECTYITEDMIKGHCDPVGEQGEDGLLHIKQEVAREIFEEIDELLHQNATMQIATSTLHCKLAELKKKYTESEE